MKPTALNVGSVGLVAVLSGMLFLSAFMSYHDAVPQSSGRGDFFFPLSLPTNDGVQINKQQKKRSQVRAKEVVPQSRSLPRP